MTDSSITPPQNVTSVLATITSAMHAIGESDCPVQAEASLIDGLVALDFQKFCLGPMDSSTQNWGDHPFLTNLPPESVAVYRAKSKERSDPTLERLKYSPLPYTWCRTAPYDDPNVGFYTDLAVSLGLNRGVLIPLEARGDHLVVFSALSTSDAAIPTHVTTQLRMIASAYLLKMRELDVELDPGTTNPAKHPTLSPVQQDIVRWMSEGKSNADIAIIMEMSKRAVDYHVSRILSAFDVATRIQAVAQSLSLPAGWWKA